MDPPSLSKDPPTPAEIRISHSKPWCAHAADDILPSAFPYDGVESSHGCVGPVIARVPSMRRRRQYLIAATAACAILLSSAAQSGPADARRVSVSNITSDVVSLTNAERARQGRKRLRSSPQLMQAAQIHAEQMARAGRLAHDLPKARYPETKDRLAAVKYRWTAYGENVAQGQNAAEVLKDWMHSSGHRKNVLNSYYTELGTGYATDRAGRTYFVQVFATPAS